MRLVRHGLLGAASAVTVVVAVLLLVDHRAREPIAQRRAARIVATIVPHGSARFVGPGDDELLIDAPGASLRSLGGSIRGAAEVGSGALHRLAFRVRLAADGAADADPRIAAYAMSAVDWDAPSDGDVLGSTESVPHATAPESAVPVASVRHLARSNLAHLRRAMPAGSLLGSWISVLVVDAARGEYGVEYDLRVSRFATVGHFFDDARINPILRDGLTGRAIVGVAQEVVDTRGHRAGAYVTEAGGASFGDPWPSTPSGDFFGQ